MRGWRRNILAGWLVAGASALAFAQTDESASLRQPPRGSIARQLLLKYRIQKQAAGTLAVSLYHNRQEWESLSPELRDRYRRDALAFEQKGPEEQARMIENFDKLIKLSAEQQERYRQRAEWLRAVVATFSPEERKGLSEMSPEDRARRLIERRDQLMREGKLKNPTTSTAPSTVPAAPDVR